MQNIKKYFMTLALLLTAVTGAWAADAYEEFTTADEEMTQLEFTGEHIKITGTLIDNDGLMIVSNYPVTISALNGKVITKVELTVSLLDLWNSTYAITSTPNATIEGTYEVGQKFTITPTGANPSEITLSANVDGLTASFQVKNWKVYYADPTEWSLTPDETGKKWTLDKMPASNIELQVEYFAESNLFLSKEALADKANIAVTAGKDPVEFGNNGKSANTVTEGTPMTVKFNGTKKVLGMKVEKKGAASKLASEVTPDDIFKVIASDGMIYDNIAAAESAGTTAQGLVVYVGSNTGNATYTHGMALALKDESDNTWSGAKDACNAKNTSTPIVGALWIQASKDQWNTMFNAVGGDCKLRDCFSSAGGTNLVKGGYYWSGSSHEDYGEQGDYYTFTEEDNWSGSWSSTSVIYNDNYHVRACIVF